jgi:gamma-glutamyl-gamma-aminobutyrate hydrolase PuuD
MSKYCLVVNGNGYYKPFDHLGLTLISNPTILLTSPEEVALVVFTGGEDVSPEIYGERNVKSYVNPRRDEQEVAIFREAMKHEIPIAGICRGAQFICAMSGGRLVQDITNHGVHHHLSFIDDTGNVRRSPEKVTSTHHQMQYPWEIDEDLFEILAWSSEPRSNHYVMGDGTVASDDAPSFLKEEPDVVFYKNTRALAIQYHPEWMERDSWGFKYAQEIISEKLGALIAERVGSLV